MKYNNWTLGQIEAVFNKLGGEEGVRRFLAGELVVRQVQPEFKVFKTVRLGTGPKNANDFRKSLKDKGFTIGEYADDILGESAFTVAAEETEMDLVVTSVAELGFKNGATREQIYARANELGLDLCPAEVGPQLRLQYKDQSNDEWLVIAMEPIADSGGCLRLFHVRRSAWRSASSGLWLLSCYGGPDSVWSSDIQFVFSRRK